MGRTEHSGIAIGGLNVRNHSENLAGSVCTSWTRRLPATSLPPRGVRHRSAGVSSGPGVFTAAVPAADKAGKPPEYPSTVDQVNGTTVCSARQQRSPGGPQECLQHGALTAFPPDGPVEK